MKPWLLLPPKIAHDIGPYGLKLFSYLYGSEKLEEWNPLTWRVSPNKSLYFPNRLGIAGGVDKNADSILDWQKLGCGFLEVGTITPRPQAANPGKIMDRDLKSRSVWNKMGFPSAGAQVVLKNLERQKSLVKLPLFINLGKNRTTSNEQAHWDYISLMNDFQNTADAFVINISSPNTKGLRDLTQQNQLQNFLIPIMDHYEQLKNKPLMLIKLSPDLDPSNLQETIHICLNYNLNGFILTNTTQSRTETPFYPQEGGVSGAPLSPLSLKALEIAATLCSKEKSKKMLISAGGVMTAGDVFERINCGADLVQSYAALIFEGPTFFRKVAQVAEKGTTNTGKL